MSVSAGFGVIPRLVMGDARALGSEIAGYGVQSVLGEGGMGIV